MSSSVTFLDGEVGEVPAGGAEPCCTAREPCTTPVGRVPVQSAWRWMQRAMCSSPILASKRSWRGSSRLSSSGCQDPDGAGWINRKPWRWMQRAMSSSPMQARIRLWRFRPVAPSQRLPGRARERTRYGMLRRWMRRAMSSSPIATRASVRGQSVSAAIVELRL